MAVSIFDWDDTLCPTHWLNEHGLLHAHAPTYDQHVALKEHDILLRNILNRACAYSDVYILTNSGEGWVKYTIMRFFPKCTQFLSRVKVCHAYQACDPYPQQWKLEYLRHHLTHLKRASQILSFGDRDWDYITVACFFKGNKLKHVHFKEFPSMKDAQQQVKYVCDAWKNLFNSTSSMIIKM